MWSPAPPSAARASLPTAAERVRSWGTVGTARCLLASAIEPSRAPSVSQAPTKATEASAPSMPPSGSSSHEPVPALLPPLADMIPIMLASCTSGMLARIPCHPLDTIKAKMQATRLPSPSAPASVTAAAAEANTMRAVLRATLRAEGIAGLYRGFWVAFIGSAPGGFSYFTSYEFSKAVITRARDRANGLSAAESAAASAAGAPPGFAVSFLAGLSAEAVSCLVWIPIDVVKERLQVQSLITTPSPATHGVPASATAASASAAATAPSGAPLRYTGTLHAISSILRYEGLRGLYRGYGATLASFGPFSALYLSSYEVIKDGIARAYRASGHAGADSRDLPSWIPFLAGGLGGGISAFVTNPLDLVKLRIQIQRRAAAAAASPAAAASAGTAVGAGASGVPFGFGYRGTLHGLRCIIAEEGTRALFKGVSARVAFAAPASAVSITLFDTLKRVFTKLTNSHGEVPA